MTTNERIRAQLAQAQLGAKLRKHIKHEGVRAYRVAWFMGIDPGLLSNYLSGVRAWNGDKPLEEAVRTAVRAAKEQE